MAIYLWPPVAWVANICYELVPFSIASINDAARKLRAIQRNWVLYPFAYHLRLSARAKVGGNG
jgi:23S rRNA (cytidine2498-2'-O)-methyltransferase